MKFLGYSTTLKELVGIISTSAAMAFAMATSPIGEHRNISTETTPLELPASTPIPGDDAYQAALRDRSIRCLAKNIYFESRGESAAGKMAVAMVTMNRVNHERFPHNVCSVVRQAIRDEQGEPIVNRCQFSWYCSPVALGIYNAGAFEEALDLATFVYDNYEVLPDITEGATHFHTNAVSPAWGRSFSRVAVIDNHIFYRM